jgi:hypothetical protein
MKQIVYVDSLYGNDSFEGDLPSPVRTLSQAISLVYEGGTVVLQTGDGTPYGSSTLTKNITIKAAYGATPYAGTLTFSNAQGLIEGLFFDSIDVGIAVNNLTTSIAPDGTVNEIGLGSVIVRECVFTTVKTCIDVVSAQYIAVHRNYFSGHDYGVKILNAQEACVSSNVFDKGARAIDISSIYRADIWGNTVYGASSVPSWIIPDTNLRVLYVTMTQFNIDNALLQLPGFASLGPNGKYDVVVNYIGGPPFLYDVGYTVEGFGSLVTWSGLELQQELTVGEMIRVMYSEDDDPGNGDAISLLAAIDPNSRVDSNSITAGIGAPDIDIGVFITRPVKIRHNNFYRNTAWWDGVTPTGDTGLSNIDTNPLYRDPEGKDFHLQYQGVSGTSPNIDAADPGRWSNVYDEMGVIKVGGQYTASYTGIRANVAPFDRSLDYDSYNRGVTGMVGTTGDIGALEFNQHETALGNYVSEQGYDIAHPGTATGPYATIDRGYARAGLGLYVSTNQVPGLTSPTGSYTGLGDGIAYGRYHSKNIVLSDSEIKVGHQTSKDTAFVYSSYPAYETGAVYVGVDAGAGATGTPGNPYRTIDQALGSGSRYVFVKPGFYPSFQGVSGVHLMGVEEISAVDLGYELYNSFMVGSWTGAGTYATPNTRTMSLTDSVDILSQFTFDIGTAAADNGIDLKYTVTTTNDKLYVGLVNLTDLDSVYVLLDKVAQHTAVGYRTSGSTYEIFENAGPYPILQVYTNVNIRIRIDTEGRFRVTAKNAYMNRDYSGTLLGAYTSPWRMFFITEGTGASQIVNPYLYTDQFTGITGILGTNTKRKVFGIIGTTGLQNG